MFEKETTNHAFSSRLLNWFDLHGRKDLPWQQNITPYRVWLSEIMLQQTQVSTVIPYFQSMSSAYPNVYVLADATLDEVLHHWTGLGYYARARNLHKTARIISEDFDGVFPDTVEQLQALPGIGRSTAGAICAIAYNQHSAILDANVKRVLTRHNAITGWPGKTAIAKQLWVIAENNTPALRTGDYTQAIMDLGATLCTRSKPACEQCPVNTNCQAFARKETQLYPGKKRSKVLTVRSTLMLIIHNKDQQILLQKRPPTGIWGGLWSFPECPAEVDIALTCKNFGLRIKSYQLAATQRHTFSHFHLDYTPVYIDVDSLTSRIADNTQRWIDPGQHGEIGLPAPILMLLQNLNK